jgi:hypothetical protein
MSPSLVARLALFVSVPLGIAACFVDSSDPPRSSTASGGAVPTADAGIAAAGDGQPSAHPILAKVDTNQTMQVSPGQGVGIFTEYVAGGHWHVWWTCDTSVNPQGASCAFAVKISVPEGSSISGVVSQGFAPTDSTTVGATELDASGTIATQSEGLLFDTPAGETISLSATVGGLYDGRFIFFVENGQIDDGYQGTVTDPIQLAPNTP